MLMHYRLKTDNFSATSYSAGISGCGTVPDKSVVAESKKKAEKKFLNY